MSSFPVPRTRLPVCFLSPFPDSLPQLFLRCFPFALAFGLFPSDPFPFVPFSSGSGYSASASSFPLSSRFPPHSGSSSVLPLRFRFLGLPRSLRPGFPCLPSRFFVLGSLFVSFHPSRLRSHSCSTDASLLLSLSGFPLTSVFFRPLPLGSDYSAFRSFFSLLPVLPCRRFLRCFFPLPSGLFPCLSSNSGTQLTAIPFSVCCLASQWLPQHLRLLPFGFWLFPLCFRFRFWLLSFRNFPFGHFLVALFTVVPSATLCILTHVFLFVNNFFKFFYFFNKSSA